MLAATFFSLLEGVARVAGVVLFLAAVGWWLWRVCRRSDDPIGLMVKWALTLANLVFIALVVAPLFRDFSYFAAFLGVPLAAMAGLFMALIWTPSLTDSVGRKFAALYDGGDVAPDPEPFFSIAEARRKQGRYAEAEEEVRRQLEVFPTHFRGHLLLAEIQAVDQRDLAAAGETVERFVSQPGHAPKNVAFALLRLSDWHLKLANDREAARAALERIIALLPETPEAHMAYQRLAHLTPAAMLEQEQSRPTLAVPEAPPRMGILTEPPAVTVKGSDPRARADALVAQLEQFPADNQAREELALLYLDEFQRPDLAADQLEQLVAQPLAPAAQIVRWLNLLADVHIRGAGNLTAAREALERVIARDPSVAAAENARRRLATLNRELQDRVGGEVTLAVPPHHRTYGSVSRRLE